MFGTQLVKTSCCKRGCQLVHELGMKKITVKAGRKRKPRKSSVLGLLISKCPLALNSLERMHNSEAEPTCYLCKEYCGKLFHGPPPTGKTSKLNQHAVNKCMFMCFLVMFKVRTYYRQQLLALTTVLIHVPAFVGHDCIDKTSYTRRKSLKPNQA